jgi:hypothetical protein
MTPREVLERAAGEPWGRPPQLTLRPPLGNAELRELERRWGAPLAAPMRELLAFASGVEREGFGDIRFAGDPDLEFPELSPKGVVLARNDAGFWMADIAPDGSWGPVFYVCHDPPVVALQARDLAGFLEQALWGPEMQDRSEIASVTGPAIARIWREEPWLASVEVARSSPDATLSEFAAQLAPTFSIADLRTMEPGTGFSWGRGGANAQVKRHGRQLIFAVEMRPRESFFRRLLRRGR